LSRESFDVGKQNRRQYAMIQRELGQLNVIKEMQD
jgi:hypothetical protein